VRQVKKWVGSESGSASIKEESPPVKARVKGRPESRPSPNPVERRFTWNAPWKIVAMRAHCEIEGKKIVSVNVHAYSEEPFTFRKRIKAALWKEHLD
jgi:hypothetical protein